MAMTIDAHHHLWRYEAEEFGWLDGALAPLRRDFLVDDLVAAMNSAGVDGAVAVQARQTVEETRWLLEMAEACSRVLGVVGWAPLVSTDFHKVMEEFGGAGKLKGLRHVIQGEVDPGFILREDFNRGITALGGMGLVYDVLVYERHLPQVIEFVDRHPRQIFVIDHVAKPRIGAGELEPWAGSMLELGKREHVFCKVSGLITEADPLAWTVGQLTPYLDVVVEAFGPGRLMAGSDWPVVLAGCSYSGWFDVLRGYFAGFSEEEREAVFGLNASGVYRLQGERC